MLQLPALADLGDDPGDVAGALVFADDIDPGLFHVVAQVPRLRRTEGVPALRFVRYRTLGPGVGGGAEAGGFLEVGVELTLTPEQQTTIVATLQRRFWRRDVRLATPAYLDGAAQLMIAPVGGALVANVEGSGAPSMSGTMTASFSAGLTELGARLLWDGLSGDSSVLAVGYAVDVIARLPPSSVRVWFDAVAARRTTTLDSLAHAGDAGTTGLQERLEQAGVAGVELDDWPVEPAFAPLRDQVSTWGWTTIARAAAALKAATDAAAHPEQVDAAAYAVDRVQTQHTGVAWRIRPQGHLPGLSAEALTHCRFSADLEHPVFDLHEVQVLANVDFAGQAIAAVDVTLTAGDARLQVSLTGPDDSAFFRYRVPAGAAPDYTYAYRVHFAHTADVLDLTGGTAHDAFHVVALPPCGSVGLLLDAAAVDWRSVTQVSAEVVRADERTAFTFSANHPSETFRRDLPGLVAGPLQVDLRYALTDGRRHAVSRPAHPGSRLLIGSPFEQTVTLAVAADGGFTRQTSVVVEVELAGVRRTLTLGAGHDHEVVRADLLPDDDPGYRWRQTVTFADGHAEVGDWADGHGSARLEVGVHPGAVLTVEPATDLVDWARVRLVRLAVQHPPAGTVLAPGTEPFVEVRALSAGGPAPDLITIPLDDPANRTGSAYSFEATYFLTDGTRRTVGPTTTTERHLVLSPTP